MEILLAVLFVILFFLAAWLFLTRFILHLCHIYVHVEAGDDKTPVLTGYVNRRGLIMDITQPHGMQRVGQVLVREGNAWVQLFHPEQGPDEISEPGYVDPDGKIYRADGQQVANVSPDGERRWWELWLRRHSAVVALDDKVIGKCVEGFRFRARRPSEVTLLARGGAASIFYSAKVKAKDETPSPARLTIWDTVLIATLLFDSLFLVPSMSEVIGLHLFLLNILGPKVSYVATSLGIFLMIWMILHFFKVILASFSDDFFYYLTMLNRQTGISRWLLLGCGLSLIGVIVVSITSDYKYLPVYLISLGGLAAAYALYPSPLWPVKTEGPNDPVPVDPSMTVPPPPGAQDESPPDPQEESSDEVQGESLPDTQNTSPYDLKNILNTHVPPQPPQTPNADTQPVAEGAPEPHDTSSAQPPPANFIRSLVDMEQARVGPAQEAAVEVPPGAKRTRGLLGAENVTDVPAAPDAAVDDYLVTEGEEAVNDGREATDAQPEAEQQTEDQPAQEVEQQSTTWKGDLLKGLAILLPLGALFFLGLRGQSPPRAVPADAPLAEFSSARAMSYLGSINNSPPADTSEPKGVPTSIVKELGALGAGLELQQSTVVGDAGDGSFDAGTIENNIVARLKGTGSGQAVLLTGQYDSSLADGLGDDSSVAVMIETLRALSVGPPLKRDVIFLFTDARGGHRGAEAFVKEHPWMSEVGLVLYLGTGQGHGPSVIIETSPRNGGLISEFAQAASHPTATSFVNELYQLQRIETNLTVFIEAGFPGLGFQNISGGAPQSEDAARSGENFDERSLQHQGSYALALSRRFGNLEVEVSRSGNATYFDIFGLFLIHYSTSVSTGLSILTGILFIGVTVLGFRKKLVSGPKVLLGFSVFLLAILLTLLIGVLVWYATGGWGKGGTTGVPISEYWRKFYILGAAVLSIGVTSLTHGWLNKKINIHEMAVGGMLCWLVSMIIVSLYMPGAGYLFNLPLLFNLVGLASDFTIKEETPAPKKLIAVLILTAIPGIILLAPASYQLSVTIHAHLPSVLSGLSSLALTLHTPHFDLIFKPGKRLFTQQRPSQEKISTGDMS